jgi:hypothetical protein
VEVNADEYVEGGGGGGGGRKEGYELAAQEQVAAASFVAVVVVVTVTVTVTGGGLFTVLKVNKRKRNEKSSWFLTSRGTSRSLPHGCSKAWPLIP